MAKPDKPAITTTPVTGAAAAARQSQLDERRERSVLDESQLRERREHLTRRRDQRAAAKRQAQRGVRVRGLELVDTVDGSIWRLDITDGKLGVTKIDDGPGLDAPAKGGAAPTLRA